MNSLGIWADPELGAPNLIMRVASDRASEEAFQATRRQCRVNTLRTKPEIASWAAVRVVCTR